MSEDIVLLNPLRPVAQPQTMKRQEMKDEQTTCTERQSLYPSDIRPAALIRVQKCHERKYTEFCQRQQSSNLNEQVVKKRSQRCSKFSLRNAAKLSLTTSLHLFLLLHCIESTFGMPHKQRTSQFTVTDQSLQQFSKEISQDYQRQTKLQRRSISSCTEPIQQLLELAYHAYTEAKSDDDRLHTKRSTTPRRFSVNRSLDNMYVRLHEKLKIIFCESHRKTGLFGQHTDDVRESLESMKNVIQLQMNMLQMPFTSWSHSSCIRIQKGYTNTVLRRRVINELYEIYTGLQMICKTH